MTGPDDRAPVRVRQHDRTPPPVPLAVANISRAKARLTRAEWLIGVAEGVLTPLDLLTYAATAPGRPLRRISLFQLLTAQPAVGPASVRTILTKLRARLHDTTPDRAMTVSWVLDNRTDGRRLLALMGSLTPTDLPPWQAWPLTVTARPD